MQDVGRIHLVSLKQGQLTQGLEYVQRRALRQTDSDDDIPTLYASGAMTWQFREVIGKTLNVRLVINNYSERLRIGDI